MSDVHYARSCHLHDVINCNHFKDTVIKGGREEGGIRFRSAPKIRPAHETEETEFSIKCAAPFLRMFFPHL